MKRLTLILTLAAILAACGGSGESGGATDDLAASPVPDGAEAPTEYGGPTGGDGAFVDVDAVVTEDRMVIRNASLVLEADDTRAAFESIVDLVEGAGGFVASADVSPVDGEDDQPVVQMVLRIPAADLGEIMSSIKGEVQEVVSESQDAADVTEQYVDLQAQLTNLQALEVELRALLEEVRKQPDADPAKLLQVFNEVSRVRGEIDQLQAQIDYLGDSVELATVSISLSPTPAVVPIVEEPWQPAEVARGALRNLVEGVQNVADLGIAFALYVVPMLLLILLVPGLIALLAFRWARRHRGPESPAAVES